VRISEFCALLGFGELVVVPGAGDVPDMAGAVELALFTSDPAGLEVVCAIGAAHHSPALSAASKVIRSFMLVSFSWQAFQERRGPP
jgi:hypothetical protein